MNDRTGLAEALLGLSGFRVLEVNEDELELVVDIETLADFVGCGECGTRAEAHDRMVVEIRDLACFGRAVRLVWHKRRWRCVEPECEAKTWTETSAHISARTVLTHRAGWEACRQVGANARPVASLARELGVCWSTVMSAVIGQGQPLVEDPERVGPVTNLGVDETSFLKANRHHATRYATGLVDLDKRMVIDMVEGNTAPDLRRWCSEQHPAWLAGIVESLLALMAPELLGAPPRCRSRAAPTRLSWGPAASTLRDEMAVSGQRVCWPPAGRFRRPPTVAGLRVEHFEQRRLGGPRCGSTPRPRAGGRGAPGDGGLGEVFRRRPGGSMAGQGRRDLNP